MAASAAACSEKSAWHGRNAAWENNEAGGEMKAGDGGAWRRGKIEKRNLSKKKMKKSKAAIENEMAMSKNHQQAKRENISRGENVADEAVAWGRSISWRQVRIKTKAWRWHRNAASKARRHA
jgi:hypothetical protein